MKAAKDNPPDLLTEEVTQALTEAREADSALQSTLNDGDGGSELSDAAIKTVKAAEVDVMRQRASRERARGAKALDKRHGGVASIFQKVELYEHVTGSAFQRWFSAIEKGIVTVTKRGQIFVGAAAAEKLAAALKERIEHMAEEVDTSLASVKARIDNIDPKMLMKPQYSSPAAAHEVQMRHPLALRVLKIIQNADEVLKGMVVLEWNGEVEESHRSDEEQKIKKAIRELHGYLSRTVRGMLSKVEQKAAANDGTKQGIDAAPEAPADSVQLGAAA